MTNKEKYFQLCKENDTICVYDMPWWMDAVCGENNWDVVLYEKNDTILGAMPYYTKSKMGLSYITQPQLTQHNGVWINYPKSQVESKRISFEKEVIEALLDQIEKKNISYYMQNQSPNLTNWLPFYWRGYRQTCYYTYRLEDISDTEQLFKDFQSNKRRNINKAKKAGYVVEFDLKAESFYLLHKRNLEKQGKEIHYSFELFKRLYDGAYGNDSGRIVYAKNENGDPVSALFNVWDKQWGYDLITALDPDTRSSGVPDLLVFSMLEYLSDKVQGYDFEGSMIPGVEESYRHFGAHQTPYFSIWKIYSNNPVIKYLINGKMKK